MFFYDVTYGLVILGALLCMIASANVKSTYNRYKRVHNSRGVYAQDVAQQMLREAGIYDVRIERVSGDLTDHYDPKAKVLRLSDTVYGSTSVAAVGVAAHECGHAIQHQQEYKPIQLRNAIVPIVNFGSNAAWPVLLLGAIMGSGVLLNIGIVLFSLAVLFQLVTLPVEFDASRRAITILRQDGILQGEELGGAKKVLTAAAMTYVASMVAILLQLFRVLLLFGRRNND
ncbi:MAG: zinc metallopeptidase [Lachnospiraceae bacterium]|nr:zinc metallopeptidase [Lachnospiraceae bacterium]